MHGRDAFVECGFTPHHADAATTERQRRDRPKLTKAVLLHDCHLPRRFGIAIPSKPPRSMSFAGDAILSARLLSSTTADFGPEVVINLPPSPCVAELTRTERQRMRDVSSTAEEPMDCTTLCRSGRDSNPRFRSAA